MDTDVVTTGHIRRFIIIATAVRTEMVRDFRVPAGEMAPAGVTGHIRRDLFSLDLRDYSNNNHSGLKNRFTLTT